MLGVGSERHGMGTCIPSAMVGMLVVAIVSLLTVSADNPALVYQYLDSKYTVVLSCHTIISSLGV